MAQIIYNFENIGDAYAPSLNAAFEDLYAASGVLPRVAAPYGGWSSQYIDAANNIKGRGPGSDHYKGRAVDIYNWSAIVDRIGRARFKAILGAHGWRNIQINGDDFSAEPWHYANHDSKPQGVGATPILETVAPPVPIEEETMTDITYYVARDANGAVANERTAVVTTTSGHQIKPNTMYYQEFPTAPIRGPLDPLEYAGFAAARKPWNDDASDARIIVRNVDMQALINKRGLAT